jgi:hypothetical protein
MEEGIRLLVGCAGRFCRMQNRSGSIPIPGGEKMSVPRIFDEILNFGAILHL